LIRGFDVLNSEALMKVQSIILVVVIVVAALGGAVAYILLSGQESSSETIKIGIIGDLDTQGGKSGLEGALLAVEQINAEGGVLGRLLEVVAEDDDSNTPTGDPSKSIMALTKLITSDKADFIIGMTSGQAAFGCQDVIAEHKKIYINVFAAIEQLTQRVEDDYDRYKYFFRYSPSNTSASVSMLEDSILCLRELTGFNRIAYLTDYYPAWDEMKAVLDLLPEKHGFELVWSGETTPGTVDFTSYFARVEEVGAEALITLIASESIPFVKEYHARQSPLVIWGFNLQAVASGIDFWEATDGKCEYTTISMLGIDAGYPVTNKTLSTPEALLNRWDEISVGAGAFTYDAVRFLLVDAIERAGTTETEAVIKALETTSVETSFAKKFEFTSSHDVLVGADSWPLFMFQWQSDGALVPVYPKEAMEEAGATYTFPDWPGPWDNLD
jgi:branched-chain amino acid transport system substrate-binding protein